MKRRLLALMMAAVMTVSLAACGGEKEETVTEQTQEFVYVAENMDFAEEAYDYINIYGLSRGIILGATSSYDADTDVSVEKVLQYDAKQNKIKEVTMDFLAQTDEEETDYARSEYLNMATLSADMNLVVLTCSWTWTWNGDDVVQTYQVYFLDEQGQVTDTVPLDAVQAMTGEDDYFYIDYVVTDDDGVLYVTRDNSITALDKLGNILFTIEAESWIQNAGNMEDGSVYIVHYDSQGNTELSLIDKASKGFGTTYDLGNHYMNGFFSIEGDELYFNSDNAVWHLNLKSGETEKLFDWLEVDMNGDYISGIQYVDENTFVTYTNDWSSDEKSFTKLVKTDSSLVQEKETLVLAALTSSDASREDVLAYNKSNDKYRIQLKTYLDYSTMSDADWQNYEQFMSDAVTRMMNDITGKNAPDIIAVGSSELDMATLAKQGVLEELTPYLEQRGYSEEDFLDGVVESFKENGKLYTLPARFGLQTMIADSAVVGEEQGWTLQEALEVINNLPEGMEFADYMTQSYFVQMCLTFGYDMFVDKENGTCNFDSDEFKAVLEMAKQFPAEYEYDEDRPSEPILASNGEILTITHYISDLEDIQYAYAMFGDRDVTFIGFPGATGNGTLLTSSGSLFAICSKSEHKDAAAEFVLDSIIKPYDPEDWTNWGIPTLKADYEAYITDKITVEYLKDENGELLLDENGDPIPEGGTSGIGWGDWEYTYHVCTQEEADTLTELIEGIEGRYHYDSTLFNMITEEAGPYFAGQKTADEAAAVIQNRISLYLSENN